MILSVDLNYSSTLLRNQLFLESFGSIKVAELQWGDESHVKAVCPPFDYIIGTDVVSVEQAFLQTLRSGYHLTVNSSKQ